MSAAPRFIWVVAHWSGTRARVRSCKASRKAATASSSRAAPPSRSPSDLSASPRLFWVLAQSSGVRSRVNSCKASRKAATASSSRAVALSRSPSVASATPRFIWVLAHSSGLSARGVRARYRRYIDRFGQRGIVAEFIPLLVQCRRLIKQQTPLLLCVERRDECGSLGIFRGGGAISEL